MIVRERFQKVLYTISGRQRSDSRSSYTPASRPRNPLESVPPWGKVRPHPYPQLSYEGKAHETDQAIDTNVAHQVQVYLRLASHQDLEHQGQLLHRYVY